jgi:plasmid stability protein
VPRLHIELPDDLHTRAKITAAVRHSTLEALVIEALERIVSETETEAEETR